MRMSIRSIPLVIATCALTAATGINPAHAAPVTATSFSSTGDAAFADFTDVPATGPVAGVTYHDVFVEAGTQANRTAGSGQTVSIVFVGSSTFTVDATGGTTSFTDAFGLASGDAVHFAASGRLAGATLTATVPLQSCDKINNVCTDAGSLALATTWTGVGPVGHAVNNGVFRTPAFSFTYHQSATFRDATAVDTTLGTAAFAQLISGRSSQTITCRLAPC